MEDKNKNAEELEEVVNPEGAEEAEITEPQPEESTRHTAEDIINMSPEDFGKYVEDARNGIAHNVERKDDKEEPENTEEEPEENPEETDKEHEKGREPEENTKPFKTFTTEDEYEKEVQQRVNHAFGKRFKNEREQKEKLDILYARAKNFYPDITRENLIEKLSDDLYRQAEINGEDITALKEKEELQLKAMRLEAIENENRQEQEYRRLVENRQREMIQQEQVIQLMDESFSIKTRAESDKLFENDLRSGKSVIEAYKASKAREEQKPVPPRQIKRKPIEQNATAPRKGTGDTKRDPSQYTDKDFNAYIEKCRKTY